MSEEPSRAPELRQDEAQVKRRRTEGAGRLVSGGAQDGLQMPAGAAVSAVSSSGDLDPLWGPDDLPDDELLQVSDQMSANPCLGGSDVADGQNGAVREGIRLVPDRVGGEPRSDDPGPEGDRDVVPERRPSPRERPVVMPLVVVPERTPRRAPVREMIESCSDDSEFEGEQDVLPEVGLRHGLDQDDGEDPHPFSAIPQPGRRVVGPLYEEISSGLVSEADGFIERVRGVFNGYSHRRGPGGVSSLSSVLREWYDRHTSLCARIDEAAFVSEVLVREISKPNEMVRVCAHTDIHVLSQQLLQEGRPNGPAVDLYRQRSIDWVPVENDGAGNCALCLCPMARGCVSAVVCQCKEPRYHLGCLLVYLHHNDAVCPVCKGGMWL